MLPTPSEEGLTALTGDQDASRDVGSCEKSDIHLTLVMIDVDLDVGFWTLGCGKSVIFNANYRFVPSNANLKSS